jgi:hypothetical protein
MDKCLNKFTGENTMQFITHNERESLIDETNGSAHVGDIEATYKEICSLFGKPLSYDKGKVDVHWVVKFNDGTVASIYNWKNGKAYMGDDGLSVQSIKTWNIGGLSQASSVLVQIAVDLQRESKQEKKPDPFEGAFSMMENIVKTKGESYAALVEVTILTMKRKQLMDMVIELLEKQTSMPKRVKKILEEMDSEICVRTISRACHASGLDFDNEDKANELMEWAAKIVSQEVSGIKDLLKKEGK